MPASNHSKSIKIIFIKSNNFQKKKAFREETLLEVKHV